ncbi:MAG: hypothetical protein GTN93_32100, partial [Anaerolineae bacterium]|nr:hypothetical protein [Anaerolineae bacterium]
VPNPWVFVSLDADVTNTPEGGEVPAFDRAGKEDLLYVGRLSGYADLSESANFTLGMSYA